MRYSLCIAICASSCALFLSGCALNTTATDSGTVQGAAIHGVAYGGRQPITGTKVYLMEAATTGYINHYAQSTLGSGFSSPYGVAVDGSGNVYVADGSHNAVKEILAASGYTTVNTLGGGFNFPEGVAVDRSGNVFVADDNNNAVKEIPLSCVTGTNDSSCVVTLGSGFSHPDAVAVDGSGNVFVAQFSPNAVKEILAAGGYTTVNTLGGSFAGVGFSGVAVDGSGNVFFSDSNNAAVKKIPLSCITGANNSSCVVTLGSGFSFPRGVAVDGSGNVFVADSGHTALKEILAVGGYTTVNTLDSSFSNPLGVAVDGSGNVYVADNVTNLVVKETVSYSHQASKSLLTTGAGSDSIGEYVLTDASGDWTISGDYTCDVGAQAYIYALGGDSGSGTNTGIGLMAALGQCPASSPFNYAAADTFVFMNEVTTVAAAYAMAGYATDATHVSSNNTSLALQGIANAFANAGNLATISTGVANTAAPGNPSNSTVPRSEINTLGNILAACVNSSTGSASCTTLFNNAKSAGSSGTTPTDTATAAINIAHNPGNAIATLFGLQTGSGLPYVPGLPVQINDFTVGITFTGNGLNGPESIAIDASGNAWVANIGNSNVSVFTPSGGVATNSPFTGNGLIAPYRIAIDASGNAWVINFNNNNISVFTSSGAAATTPSSPLSGNGLSTPYAIAIDASGNAWVANIGNSNVSEFTNSGGAAGSSPFSGNGLDNPQGIAIDASGNAWVTDARSNKVSEFTSSGGAAGSSPFSGNGLSLPLGIAIDASGNAWVANFNNNNVSIFSSSGGTAANSPISGGGLNYPYAIAIDGSGNAWVANYNFRAGLSEFSSSGSAVSPSTGLGTDFFAFQGYTNNVAIDGSGNVWTADYLNGILIELVGAATPVVTPIVTNLLSPYGSHAVNIP